MRQPECSATTPQRHVAPGDVGEARPCACARQLALRREAADALVQIAIGLGVPGDERPKNGSAALGIGVVEAAERRRRHLAELQAVEAAARLQHAMRLAQRLVDVGDVAQAEGDRVGVERAVGERQGLGIARRPGEARQQPAIDGAVAADRQHRRVDVADRDVGPLALPAAGGGRRYRRCRPPHRGTSRPAAGSRRRPGRSSRAGGRRPTSGRSSGRSAAPRSRTPGAPCRPFPPPGRRESRRTPVPAGLAHRGRVGLSWAAT